MRIHDDNGYTYDDDPTTPEDPGSPYVAIPRVRIKADLKRRLREYRAELAKEKKAKGQDFFTAQETLDFLAGR